MINRRLPQGVIMNNSLTTGKIAPALLRFMLPLFIGNIFQQLYNMADTIIVGRFVGQNALAAVGSTGTIMFLVIGFSQGLTGGFTILTSQKYGAGDEKGVKESVANGILLSAIVILVITLVSTLSMRGVLTLMNTPSEIFADAYTYISIICLGTACSVSYNLFSAFLRAIGNSRIPLIFLVLSACLNVVLDLVFIIVFHMGVAGAAHATNLSQAISAALCLVYIVRRIPVLVPERHMWRFYPYATGHQLRVGVPMALQFAITASGTMIMQSAVNLFGATAVAATTAAGKVHNLFSQGDMSMGQTMAAYTGQNYGAGNTDRIRGGVKASVIIMTLYSVIAGALVLLVYKPALGLFFKAGTDISAMLPYAHTYIVLCVTFYIPLAMIFIFRNTMQGCGFGFLPMMGGVVELICRLLMAAASMKLMSYPLAAFCDPFAWIGAGAFTAIAYRFVIRKVEKILSEEYNQNHL